MSWEAKWTETESGWTWQGSYNLFTVKPHPSKAGKWLAVDDGKFSKVCDSLDDAKRACQDQDRRMRM